MGMKVDPKDVLAGVILVCGTITALIGGLVLVGWVWDWGMLTSWRTDYIPMAPNAALIFILSGVTLVVGGVWPANRIIRTSVNGVGLLTLVVAGMSLIGSVLGLVLEIGHWLLPSTGTLRGAPIGLMSPITSFSFIFSGAALLLLGRQTRNRAGIVGAVVMFVGWVNVTGYWYGAPLLYGGTVIPVALPTTLALVLLGAGLVTAAGPQAWPLSILSGPTTRSLLMRGLLPAILIVILIHGLVNLMLINMSVTSVVLETAVIDIVTVLAVFMVASRLSRRIGDTIDRADQKTRDQSKFLASVLESLDHPFFVVDAKDHSIVMANSASGVVVGTQESKCYSLPFTVDRRWSFGEALCPIETTKDTRKSLTFEHTYNDNDGAMRAIEIHCHPVLDYDGNTSKVIHYVTDVTQRKRAEKELRDYAEEVQDLYNNAPCGYHSLDTNGTFIRINDTELTWLGYTKEEVLGEMKFSDILTEESSKIFNKSFTKFKQLGLIKNLELELVRKDGTILPLILSGTAVKDASGNYLMSRSTIFDISERKIAEQSLKESEKRFRSLSEASFEGIVISRDGIILDINENFTRMTGYDVSELIGKNVIALSTEKFRDIVTENILLNKEEPYEAELLRKDGSVIPVTIRGKRATHKGTNVRVASVKDISAVRIAEEESENLRAQLFQSQKMEAIGALAGGIAHDFNNILFAILGYTELAIQDVPKDHRSQSYLEKVVEAGNRAKDLVKQILSFSRHSEQELALLQIGPITKEALKFLRASIPTTIEIRQSIQNDLGLVKADPTRIHQVLMNLCTNAAHAMREKGGVLDVELSNVEIDSTILPRDTGMVPGLYVRLSVSDTGSGMSPETLNRIFEPYFTTKLIGEGTGLGLAVVYGIIKKMGATIKVSSERGKGSTFEILFPRIADEKIVQGVDESITAPRGHEHILWVDDEEDVVDIGKSLLERLGYEIQITTSSVDALELFRAEPREFDLIITDMTMPQMSGMDLAEKILSIRPDIPIILCTGFSNILTEESIKASGISALVMKPIISQEMAQAVRETLDQVISAQA